MAAVACLAAATVVGVERVVVIGCGGSGKTYVARRLARELSLPLTHLDAEYYDQAWQPASCDRFEARQRELVARPRWLIEGNYASTLKVRLAAADTVVFLDLPAWSCLAGVLQRRLRYRGGQHRRDGVFDRLTWSFVRYVWGYRRTMRPRVHELVMEHQKHLTVVRLTSRRRTRTWLNAQATPKPW